MATEGLRKLEKLILDKIRKRSIEISRNIYDRTETIDDLTMVETDEHLSIEQARKLPYKRVKPGTAWGKPWSTAWFRLRFQVPREFCGGTVSLQFATGGEAILFREGHPVQALDQGRDRYILLRPARGGEKFELFVEAGANNAMGDFWGRPSLGAPTIAVVHQEVFDTWQDVCRLLEMVRLEPKGLDEGDTRRAIVIRALDKATNAFDYRDRPSKAASPPLAVSARF